MARYKVCIKVETVEYWTVEIDAKSKNEAVKIAEHEDFFTHKNDYVKDALVEFDSSDNEVVSADLLRKKKGETRSDLSKWFSMILGDKKL